MRFLLVASLSLSLALVLPLLSACNALGIRANPRVAKITHESETSRSSTTFDYDDDGHLTEVEDEFRILELDWNDGQLVEVNHKDPDGDTEDFKRDLEYQNGRLVELTGELGDAGDDVTTIDYDKGGRIEKVEQDQLDGAAVSTSLYAYDDAGRLVQIVNKNVFESVDEFGDDALVRSETRTELEYEDGRLVSVSVKSDDSQLDLDLEYEDGRLASMDVTSVFGDGDGDDEQQESSGTITYEYNDDGLIKGAELDGDDDVENVDIEIDYDDGDALDLDVTPTSSLFFVPSFDLRGNAFSSIDSHTQAARMAGVNW